MPTTDEPVFREVSVVNVSDISSAYPVELSVDLIRPTITSEETAVLEIVVRWTGSHEATLLFGDSKPIELPKISSESPPSLILYPRNPWVERDSFRPECWQPDLDPDYSIGHGLGLQRVTVTDGDVVSCKAEVWGDYRTDECLPPGEYSFTENLPVKDADPNHREWHFSLRLEAT